MSLWQYLDIWYEVWGILMLFGVKCWELIYHLVSHINLISPNKMFDLLIMKALVLHLDLLGTSYSGETHCNKCAMKSLIFIKLLLNRCRVNEKGI